MTRLRPFTLAWLGVSGLMAAGLQGCSTDDTPNQPTPPGTPPSMSTATPEVPDSPSAEADMFQQTRARPDAPVSVSERTGRLSCGHVVLGHGESVPAGALECLLMGDASRDRELAIAWPTVEGQPILHFFLLRAGDDVLNLDVSTHLDDFGPKQWTHRTCAAEMVSNSDDLRMCGQE